MTTDAPHGGTVTGTRRTIVRCPHGALGTVMARIEEFGLELLDVRLVASRLDR
jgi:hypothetical protein